MSTENCESICLAFHEKIEKEELLRNKHCIILDEFTFLNSADDHKNPNQDIEMKENMHENAITMEYLSNLPQIWIDKKIVNVMNRLDAIFYGLGCDGNMNDFLNKRSEEEEMNEMKNKNKTKNVFSFSFLKLRNSYQYQRIISSKLKSIDINFQDFEKIVNKKIETIVSNHNLNASIESVINNGLLNNDANISITIKLSIKQRKHLQRVFLHLLGLTLLMRDKKYFSHWFDNTNEINISFKLLNKLFGLWQRLFKYQMFLETRNTNTNTNTNTNINTNANANTNTGNTTTNGSTNTIITGGISSNNGNINRNDTNNGIRLSGGGINNEQSINTGAQSGFESKVKDDKSNNSSLSSSPSIIDGQSVKNLKNFLNDLKCEIELKVMNNKIVEKMIENKQLEIENIKPFPVAK